MVAHIAQDEIDVAKRSSLPSCNFRIRYRASCDGKVLLQCKQWDPNHFDEQGVLQSYDRDSAKDEEQGFEFPEHLSDGAKYFMAPCTNFMRVLYEHTRCQDLVVVKMVVEKDEAHIISCLAQSGARHLVDVLFLEDHLGPKVDRISEREEGREDRRPATYNEALAKLREEGIQIEPIHRRHTLHSQVGSVNRLGETYRTRKSK